MIWIVSGPSCCGKSTFIRTEKALQITGLSYNEEVIFPFQIDFRLLISLKTGFFHYNILRPLWKIIKKRPAFYISFLYPNPILVRLFRIDKLRCRFIYDTWDYKLDYQWMKFLSTSIPKKAIVLVADNQALIKRTSEREEREKDPAGLGILKRDYPARRWAFVYTVLDLPLIYDMWCEELRRAGIEFILLDAETYEQLHGHSLLQASGKS